MTSFPDHHAHRGALTRPAQNVWRLAALAAAMSTGLGLASVQAAPTAGQVVSGIAGISSQGAVTTVQQGSAKAIIEWQGFSIGQGETVRFVQPDRSSVALNRVLGSDASAIYGKLEANGQVFLVNPNGVLFGRGAEVNVGGLLASTLDLSRQDFLAGRLTLAGNSSASVVNQGSIKADGGSIALLGARVSNQGTLQANLGTVVLAAGQQATLDFHGDGLLSVQVEKGALQALVENRELVRADGGRVIMTARAADQLASAVVNNSGVVQARTLQNRGGVISLLGDMQTGSVQLSGTLDASAPLGGDGGHIETSAATVKVADSARVSSLAAAGRTGAWLIDPHDYTVAASGGDISGATLSAQLASNNITLQSSAGAGSGAGNLNVNDALSWSANTRLTLVASNHVNVNASLTASGTAAGLTISPNTANGGEAASGSGAFNLGQGARINLPKVPASAAGALVISGNNYVVINQLGSAADRAGESLQGIQGRLDGFFALGSDIDASASAGWNGGAGFMPLGQAGSNFRGSFDGLGHSIRNLGVNRPTASDVGLFGMTDSTALLQNVGLDGGRINGSSNVGALVGSNKGQVLRAWSTASVLGSSDSDSIGGLVGANIGKLAYAYASGPVSGLFAVGGLVGSNFGSIEQAFASGRVSALPGGLYAGGLVGDNSGSISTAYATTEVAGASGVGGLAGSNNGTIRSVYASGAVSGSKDLGGLVGKNTALGSLAQAYWNSDARAAGVGNGSAAGAQGLSRAQMSTAANFAGFSFTSQAGGNGWVLVNGDGGLNNAGGAGGATTPMLASEFSSTIANAHQLQLMAMATQLSYALSRDIDAAATGSGKDVWGSAGFAPIGNASRPFSGQLDGGFHSINALNINLPAANGVGLIGSMEGGALSQLGLAGGVVRGQSNVGSLVGYNHGGRLQNVYSQAQVTGSVDGDAVGGLVGYHSGSIDTAYASGAVQGNTKVGGLVGRNAGGSITGSYAGGGASGASRVGGLVGYSVAGLISGSFWNKDANPIGLGFGDADSARGLSNAQLMSKAAFGSAAPAWDFDTSWIVYEGNSAPLLRGFMSPLTIGVNDSSKTYDGQVQTGFGLNYSSTPDARLLGTALVGGAAAAATQVGRYEATVAGLYSGQQGYAIDFRSGQLSITPATLTVSGARAQSKVYDSTRTASISGASLSGLVAGDAVTLTQAALFANQNVGQGIAVTANFGLSGSAAKNYLLTQPTGLAADITPRALTVGGQTVVADKVYDGNVAATLSGGQLQGVLAGDRVSMRQTGQFASKNVGTAIAVNATSNLQGADAGNYALLLPQGLSASITPKTLQVGKGTTANSRTYDGSTQAVVSGGHLSGVVNGDDVNFSQSGSFADKNAGKNKPVSYANQISGADIGNYLLSASGGTVLADILPRTLEVVSLPGASKVYDGSTAADLTGNLRGLLAGETVTLSGSYANKNVGTDKVVSYLNQLAGADAQNYSLGVKKGSVTASITPKTLTVAGTLAPSKVYDGNTEVELSGGSLVGVVGGDALKLIQVGEFASKNAGRHLAVNAKDSISGAAAGNYVLLQPTGLTGEISPRELKVSGGSAKGKIYDGNTTAVVTGGTVSGVIKGDKVQLDLVDARFSDKNAATGKTVSFGYRLSGDDAGNYTPSKVNGEAKATIKPMPLAVDDSGVTAADKPFDGTTAATISGATISDVLAGDKVTLIQTGEFTNPKIGADKTVVYKFAISGKDMGNYVLTLKGGKTTAEITEP